MATKTEVSTETKTNKPGQNTGRGSGGNRPKPSSKPPKNN